MRRLGIDIISEVSWGTHLCQFYQTKDDLVDILVPYFKTGLENNEFCMWVTTEPLNAEDAKRSLKKVVKNFDSYIEKGQIEILDASQWYTKTGSFDPDKVLQGWVEKEKQALNNGFDGLRLTGNTSWLEKKDWKSFIKYEETVNSVIRRHRMIALCSYSLSKCKASEIIDVVSTHQSAFISQHGKREFIETSEHKLAKEEMLKANQELEERVKKRIEALLKKNHRLQQIIKERMQAETKVKQLNKELEQQLNELDVINKELESFSYSVSHDLRAPLRAIDGFSSILLEDYSSHLDAEGQRYLNLIRAGVSTMGQLIDDLLNFSRLSRKEVRISEINMNDLTKAVFSDLKHAAADRNLQMKITPLPPARGDRSMIKQVIFNLLSNAIKFTRPRETAVIEVGCKLEADEHIYYVKDNGVGFDMRYVGKLFDIFQRLHSPGEYEGTGVGLALAKRIIQRHGGRIWAEGKVNQGASFYFTLRRKRGTL